MGRVAEVSEDGADDGRVGGTPGEPEASGKSAGDLEEAREVPVEELCAPAPLENVHGRFGVVNRVFGSELGEFAVEEVHAV